MVAVTMTGVLMASASSAGAAWTGYNDGQGNIGAGPAPFASIDPSATWNVVTGGSMLPFSTTGSYNVASGNHAMWNNKTGSWNTATGTQALEANTSGVSNVATGFNALIANT